MFETVGRSEDPEARRRHVASVGLTTVLLAAGIGFQVGLATWFVSDLVTAAEPDDVVLVMVEPAHVEEDPGGAPPPPPRGGRGTADPTPPEPRPSEPIDDIPELDPVVPERVQDTSGAPGTADGDPDGVDGGEVGGLPHGTGSGRGTGSGTGDGDGDGGIRVVHQSELRRTRTVNPEYPRSAQGMGLGRVSCDARITVDERGVPAEVEVTGCPSIFHADVRSAMLRSRWAPPRIDGQRARVQTLLRIHFQER